MAHGVQVTMGMTSLGLSAVGKVLKMYLRKILNSTLFSINTDICVHLVVKTANLILMIELGFDHIDSSLPNFNVAVC